MKKPILLVVDDDPQVLRAVKRDLQSRYRSEYRILATESAKEALEALTNYRIKGEAVALLLSDQRMPEMLGVEFLEEARKIFPEAKRALLTAYSDTDAAIKAINEVQLDYYLLKPWDPPEERLYPVIDDLLEAWSQTFQPEFEGIRIVGYQWSPRSHEIKEFLSGNLKPYQWLDIESNQKAEELLELAHIERKELPAVFFENGEHLLNPQLNELGEKVGLKSKAQDNMYDVIIIGAGPAGLAASVYGGSEGLKTLLIEKKAPGGQAGTSSRIENYLGFPSGLSGSDLARRAITQAERFGIEFLAPQEVSKIEVQDHYKLLTLGDKSQVYTKSVVVTTGVDYRKLDAPSLDQFTGAGVYYGAATTEAAACRDQDVYIVGGGNSAGQAAMYLSKFAKNVYIVIRRDDLSSSMSQYLIDQIDQTPNIHLIPRCEVKECMGSEHLEKICLEFRDSGNREVRELQALFIFIGARPYTDWIPETMLKNQRGFLITGKDLTREDNFGKVWKLKREPYFLETSIPGIFAAGDVRAGTMNRVASAVGEGSMSIKFVHEYLAEI